MLKRKLCMLILLLLSLPTYAMKEGLYLGLGVGMQNIDSNLRVTDVDGNETEIVDAQLGHLGFSGTGFFGYSMAVSQVANVAIQLDADIGDTKVQIKHIEQNVGGATNTTTQQERIKRSFGASGRLEWLFCKQAKAYAIIGYRRGNFSRTTRESGAPTVKVSQDLNGVEYGFGMQLAMTEQVDLRLEVSETDYQKENPVAPASVTVSIDNKVQKAQIGLVWSSDVI